MNITQNSASVLYCEDASEYYYWRLKPGHDIVENDTISVGYEIVAPDNIGEYEGELILATKPEMRELMGVMVKFVFGGGDKQ